MFGICDVRCFSNIFFIYKYIKIIYFIFFLFMISSHQNLKNKILNMIIFSKQMHLNTIQVKTQYQTVK